MTVYFPGRRVSIKLGGSICRFKTCSRACFKIAFWHLCVTVCGRFVPDEGRVAGYVT
ncbi:MAG: DUF6783 domain-containing protein [Clostridiales bacterium]|nr:DUF6783 domain-containing protein [Clostridiales bacterium]